LKVEFDKWENQMGSVQFQNLNEYLSLDNEMAFSDIPGLKMGEGFNILFFIG